MYPNPYELEHRAQARQQRILQEADNRRLLRKLPPPLRSWLVARLYWLAQASQRAAKSLETQLNPV